MQFLFHSMDTFNCDLFIWLGSDAKGRSTVKKKKKATNILAYVSLYTVDSH